MDFLEFPYVLPYVKTTWIDKDKERFVACWADTIMHFWKYDIKLVCYWLFFYEPLLGSSNNGRYRDEYSRSALISEYSALYQVQEICSSTSHNTVGWVYISDIRELETEPFQSYWMSPDHTQLIMCVLSRHSKYPNKHLLRINNPLRVFTDRPITVISPQVWEHHPRWWSFYQTTCGKYSFLVATVSQNRNQNMVRTSVGNILQRLQSILSNIVSKNVIRWFIVPHPIFQFCYMCHAFDWVSLS